MSNKYANVVVHLSGPVGPAERAGIEQAIAAQPGVGRAATSPTAKRLMLVDYDPFTTTAQHILETVRGRGVPAQLIGM
jgi:hypothetical protein